MGIGRMSTKQFVSIGLSSLQGLLLPAIGCVGERLHNDIIMALHRDSPSMGPACLVVYADDVAPRSHAEKLSTASRLTGKRGAT
jgi:hypothetical protein